VHPIQKRTAYERVLWWETPPVQLGLLAFFYFLHTWNLLGYRF
jgi:hypothetical protein